MTIPESLITETIPEELLNEEELTSVLAFDSTGTSIFETQVKLKNPFDFDIYKFAPSKTSPTFERFLELTEQILIDTQKRENVIESEQISFTDEYPNERIDRFGEELITWRLISRKGASTSPDGKSRISKGWAHSYQLRSPKEPDKILTVENRSLDHIVEFSCWSKRARLANRRALWLERTLVNNTYAYLIQGIDRFLFEERLADNYMNVGGQALYQRSLRFAVRLNEFRVKANTAFTHITLESRTTDSLKN